MPDWALDPFTVNGPPPVPLAELPLIMAVTKA